jgi:hypothetical protein
MKAWKRQERRLAKRRGGRTTWGSGSGPQKEDVVDAVALAQCKSTSHSSFSLKVEDLKKLRTNAASTDKVPYMELLFVRPNPLDNLRVYVVFEHEFMKHFPKGGSS